MREAARPAPAATPARAPAFAAAAVRAPAAHPARPGAHLLRLQQGYGNRYVQRAVARGGAGLVVGRAGDAYERAADRVADQLAGGARAVSPVAAGSARGLGAQRGTGAGGGRLAAPAAGPTARPIAQAIEQARGAGAAIPARVREPVERALGADFGAVRVHADAAADRLSRGLGALAFTTGRDIFFRRGQYQPGTAAGRRVLAHELTHVVQQSPAVGPRGGSPGGPTGLVQCLFPDAAHAGGPAELNRVDNKPANYPVLHQGIAALPTNYVAPTYKIAVKEGRSGLVARIRRTGDANIGDSDAAYLGRGDHLTVFRWGAGHLYQGLTPTQHLVSAHSASAADVERVIMSVSSGIARGSKTAEQEHLDDYRYAYMLTLEAAEEAIDALAGQSFTGKTSTEATANARAALLTELDTRSNGNLTTINPQDWATTYQTLFQRSGPFRDGQGYHLQDLAETGFWSTAAGRKLGEVKWGFPVHYVSVTHGPQFQLGISSASVVDPHHGG